MKNVSKFHDSLKNTDWQSIYNENDANIAYDSFLSKYFDIYNSSFPLKKVKASKHVFKRPWLSAGLLKSIKRKSKLYKKFLNFPTPTNEENYKKYRNKLHAPLFTSS